MRCAAKKDEKEPFAPPRNSIRTSFLSDEVKKQVKVEVLETEGGHVDARLRLEIIAAEEQRIKEEQRQEEVSQTTGDGVVVNL